MASKTRFAVALHVMTFIASKDAPVKSAQIARSVGTNPVVVRRILSRLAEAGLVESRRGRAGGTALAYEPDEITLREIYVAVDDGPLLDLHPLNRYCPLARRTRPGLEAVAEHAETAVHEALEEITLAKSISGSVKPVR